MRAIFVNHCHPDCPHVCGTRAREFAHALARQGHRIILLTETLHRSDPAPDPDALSVALASHDWTAPFYLAVRPRAAPVLQVLRAGRLPATLRAAIVAFQYIVRGGMFTDWRDASRAYWQQLADAFRPEVVWGIFGNTDAWAIAQGIARAAGCPWVRDLKDQWTAFIPTPFRAHLSWRYGDASAVTALSAANAGDAQPWFPGAASIIYSGLPASLPASRGRVGNASLSLTLVGAVYEAAHLKTLVDGLRQFCADSGRLRPALTYVGTDTNAVEKATATLLGLVDVDIRGQLPFAEYWAAICAADLNIYIRINKTGWWHHKIVELLGARRPILCIPGEIEEARLLAQHAGGHLVGAGDAVAVAGALEAAWRVRALEPQAKREPVPRDLTWDARADKLAAILSATSAVSQSWAGHESSNGRDVRS